MMCASLLYLYIFLLYSSFLPLVLADVSTVVQSDGLKLEGCKAFGWYLGMRRVLLNITTEHICCICGICGLACLLFCVSGDFAETASAFCQTLSAD